MILQAVPTNIITGFLGSGKTSLIKRLLEDKPKNQVWAVLVNEFGQIGLDASLLNQSGKESIQIKEVAGGCICCAAGVPLQVAVNQLLMKAKPDRLLIEPTGLGHPKSILNMLSEPHFKQSIFLNSCVTLVDARKLADERYIQHESFNQQLLVSDIVLAAKSDSYKAKELTQLTDYLAELGLAQCPVQVYSDYEPIPKGLLEALELPRKQAFDKFTVASLEVSKPFLSKSDSNGYGLFLPDMDEAGNTEFFFDDKGIYRQSNQGEGYFSYGWVFDINHEFTLRTLVKFVNGITGIRIKLVAITDEGIVGMNIVDGELNAIELDEAMDSRIEIISDTELDSNKLEQMLLGLV